MKSNIEWLKEVAGPPIKRRIAAEIACEGCATVAEDRQDAPETDPECERWLSRLNECDHIHSGKVTAAENCIAKLVALGYDASSQCFVKCLDDAYRRLYSSVKNSPSWHKAILFPFLVSAGYAGENNATLNYAELRLRQISEYVKSEMERVECDDDDVTGMHLSYDEKRALGIPKQWMDKYVWKPEITMVVPTCYDFYLFSYLRGYETEREAILRYVSSNRYQRFCRVRHAYGAYGWDSRKRYCFSTTTMPYFQGFFGFGDPDFAPNLFTLYLDLVSRYPGAAENRWYQSGIQHLEQYRIEEGRYRFPGSYLPEKRQGYYLYGGAFMGLGERGRDRLLIESTFRMLSMKANAKML